MERWIYGGAGRTQGLAIFLFSFFSFKDYEGGWVDGVFDAEYRIIFQQGLTIVITLTKQK